MQIADVERIRVSKKRSKLGWSTSITFTSKNGLVIDELAELLYSIAKHKHNNWITELSRQLNVENNYLLAGDLNSCD